MFTECLGQFLDAMLEHRPTFLHVAPPLVTPIRCLHKKRPYLDYQMLLDDHDDHAKAKGVCKKKNVFLGLCPKHWTPPTHRARLGLH